MKKIKFYGILSLIALLASCADDLQTSNFQQTGDGQKIILSSEEFISIAYDNPGEISEEQLFNSVTRFAQEFNGQPESRNSAPVFSVKEKYYYSSDGKQANDLSLATRSGEDTGMQPLVYEIEVQQGELKSLAIVSADERTDGKVVYFGPDIDDLTNLDNIANVAVMIAMAKGSIIGDIQKVENIKDSLRTKTLEKLSEKLNISVDEIEFEAVSGLIATEASINSRYDNPYDGYQEDELGYISDRFGPVSPLMWAQDKFYNNEMPIKTYYNSSSKKAYDDHAYAGCANVAIGQIFVMLGVQNLKGKTNNGVIFDVNTDSLKKIHVLQDPEYSWSTTSWNDINMVAGYLRWLADETKSTYKTKFVFPKSYYASTATTDANIKNMLGRFTTYTESANGSIFNSSDAQRSLLRNCPLLVGGKAYLKSSSHANISNMDHAFIIDGLYTVRDKTLPYTSYIYYFHVNLGEAFSYDDIVTKQPAFFRTTPNNVNKFETIYGVSPGTYVYINSEDLWTLFNITKK